MKYTFSEELIWFAMNGTIFKWLKERRPQANIDLWKKDSKSRYKQMVSQVDDIGKLTQNPLRISLDGGIVWLAIYEMAAQQMSEEMFGEMVTITMDAPLFKKAFSSKRPFSIKNQKNKIKMEKVSNSISDSPFNWQTHTTMGRDENEYTTTYTQCGLCELGRRFGHSNLVPYMCKMDYLSIDLMGGVLDRTKTLATGCDCCDFHIYKKGSKWDTENNKKEN